MRRKTASRFTLSIVCLPVLLLAAAPVSKTVNIITAPNHHSRISYGVQKLTVALKRAGYTITANSPAKTIYVGTLGDQVISKVIANKHIPLPKIPGKEGFIISYSNNAILVAGPDNSGALYGCMELADRITTLKSLPVKFSYTDKPEMVLRGACVGVQKPALLPGRGTYEYPYTPENFPWFYNKAFGRATWIRWPKTG
jgi:hypothetical protein